MYFVKNSITHPVEYMDSTLFCKIVLGFSNNNYYFNFIKVIYIHGKSNNDKMLLKNNNYSKNSKYSPDFYKFLCRFSQDFLFFLDSTNQMWAL